MGFQDRSARQEAVVPLPFRRAGVRSVFGCAMSGIAALALITACDSSDDTPIALPPPGPAPNPAVTITIDDLTYSDLPTITPGAVVTVVNHDQVRHSVTSRRPGLFDKQVEAGQTITFKAPVEIGSHPFYCRYHAFMEGWFSIRQRQ